MLAGGNSIISALLPIAKFPMKCLIALLIGIGACASAVAAEQLAACRNSIVPIPLRPPVKDLSGDLPAPDYLDTIIGCNTSATFGSPPQSAPKSAWLDSERLLYQEALAKSQVDVLILPFQVQSYGLDRIERSLMTAELAYAIGDASDYKIADPFLVARALGEGSRRLDPQEADRLARKLGATAIITGYVGHDLHHSFTLTLQVRNLSAQPSAAGGRMWQHDWRVVPFTDERMPAFVFNDMLPDVLRVLPLRLGNPTQLGTAEAAPLQSPRITQTPRELTNKAQVAEVVPAIASFDLLGTLGAMDSELSGEREFERAVLVSLRSRPVGGTAAFFRAYALKELWRRPAALAAIAEQSSAEALALRALLNGDLPGAQKFTAQVPPSLERLLLDIDLRDLEAAYGHKLQTTVATAEQTFGATRAQWEPLVQLRGSDSDAWSLPDPLLIKALLDGAFPVQGLDANSIMRGGAVARNELPDAVDVDLTNVRHVLRAAAQIDPPQCCRMREVHPTAWDLLWLLEGRSEARISKSLDLQISLQGLPQSALHEISRYEVLMSGEPALALRHTEAALSLYQKSADDMRAGLLPQVEQGADLAAHFAPGENAIAWGALISMGIPSPRSQYMADAYGYDYPRRPYWPQFFFGFESEPLRTAMALEALAFSTSEPEPLNWLPPGAQPGHAGAVIAALGDRFLGNPRRPVAQASGPVDAEHGSSNIVARLQAAIVADPESWQNYKALSGYLLTSGGTYQAVCDAFLQYPGFHDPNPDNPVALSNRAAEAGSVFYWLGLPDLAKPLYRISAGLQTGSEAGMMSQARLQIIAGDYVGAAAILRDRGIRYDSPQAYRDYLSFLHAFGKSKEAWEAFSQIKASFELPDVWVAALVGHRREGLGESANRRWLMQPEIRDAHFRRHRFAPYYAVLWDSTDRMPAPDLSWFVEQLDGPPAARIDVDGYNLLVPSGQSDGTLLLARPSPFRAGKSPKLPRDTPVKSELAYFADAYAAVRAGDYETAVARFTAMADRWPIEGYPLAYFAYAAAKTGDKEHLERYLEPRKQQPDFDYWLAEALFAGARKDADAALHALQSAFRVRPNTDFRPTLTEYEYVEVCEWLLKDTGDVRFRNELLDWARKHQLVQPTYAWAYTVEYAYDRPGPQRTRALALAHYLDPASPRIQSASTQELEAAQDWFREHNPFRLPDPGDRPTLPLRSS
jgi:hypothetical protein